MLRNLHFHPKERGSTGALLTSSVGPRRLAVGGEVGVVKNRCQTLWCLARPSHAQDHPVSPPLCSGISFLDRIIETSFRFPNTNLRRFAACRFAELAVSYSASLSGASGSAHPDTMTVSPTRKMVEVRCPVSLVRLGG